MIRIVLFEILDYSEIRFDFCWDRTKVSTNASRQR